MAALLFDGAESLESWLTSHGVPIADYGRGSAKSITDLFEEVVKGESTLQLVEGAPARSVSVVTLLVTNMRGEVLTEARQRLPDGRERERGLPLSEKLLAGEGWREGAVRAVAEELGSALADGWHEQLVLDEDSYSCSSECLQSPSYPGLTTFYTVHRATASLPCLPQGPFQTQETARGGRLVTWWEWRCTAAAELPGGVGAGRIGGR